MARLVPRAADGGLRLLWVVLALSVAAESWGAGEETDRIIERMRSAYAAVSDYQMRVDSVTYEGERVREETQILYRYKKPGRVRVDFVRPREGWVLVYPSEEGRVVVRPAGFLRFLKLSLDPDSALLTVWPGQQVTQTDLGLLIERIAQSLTTKRLGPAEVSKRDGDLVIRVEAENHFRSGVPTRYEFRIDAARWLPLEVREEIPQEGRKRRIRFRELQTNIGSSDALYQLD